MKINKAFFVAAALSGLGMSAHADDYGCKVLLCLSNPNGPTAVQECKPPIEQFLREQAEKPPKPFPQCPEANGQAGVQQGINPYDQCPDGTKALATGATAIQGFPAITNPGRIGRPTIPTSGHVQVDAKQIGALSVFTGIGDGEGMRAAEGKKVCAAAPIGTLTVRSTQGVGDEMSEVLTSYPVYDRIVTMDAAKGSPRYFDVNINNKPYRRVRF